MLPLPDIFRRFEDMVAAVTNGPAAGIATTSDSQTAI